MQDQHPPRRIPLALAAGIATFFLTTGSAVAWWAIAKRPPAAPETTQKMQQAFDPPASSDDPLTAKSSQSSPAPERQASSVVPPNREKTPEVYWLKPSEKAIALAPAPSKPGALQTPSTALETAMQELLAGPGDAGETTTIPTGTKLRSVTKKADGIHIDLSEEFKTGGGTTSMTGRVAQVLYTATSVDPKASVWISVEGKPLETLGGEGLVLEQPMTRDRFKQDFPPQQ
jgi:spore germination protein GerM